MTSPQNTVALIGYPIALNLRKGLASDYKLLVCDVVPSALERFHSEAADRGLVETIDHGFKAAQRADIFITMLSGSTAVKDVYLNSQAGVIAGVEKAILDGGENKIIMECGTIETATILAVAERAKESSVADKFAFVDAPVSGGPIDAQDGTLTFMVGADDKEIFPTAKPYLSHMGKADAVFLCGDVGAGTAFEIINDYLSATTSPAASEALNIDAKMGVDLSLLTDVINVSGGQCWVTSKSNPVPGIQENVPSTRNHAGGFRIELCAKVLKMGSELANMVGARTVLDKPTLEAFGEAMGDARYQGKGRQGCV